MPVPESLAEFFDGSGGSACGMVRARGETWMRILQAITLAVLVCAGSANAAH